MSNAAKNMTGFAPGVISTDSGSTSASWRTLEVACDGVAELRDTGAGGVAMLAFGECALTGLDDVVRRGEVGLSDAEVDDRASLGGEPVGFGEDFEGGLGPEILRRAGWKHHVQPPMMASVA